MASGPLGAGGGAGGGGEGAREKHRWAESKVYTRKANRSFSKSNPNSHPQQQQQEQQQKQLPQTLEDVSSSLQPPQPAGDPSASAASENEPSSLNNNREDAAGEAAPGANNHGYGNHKNGLRPLVSHRMENGELHRVINFASSSRPEVRELRRVFREELEQVRGLIRRLEAREQHIAAPVPVSMAVEYNTHSQLSSAAPAPVPMAVGYNTHSQLSSAAPAPVPMAVGYNTHSQLSVSEGRSIMTVKRPVVNSDLAAEAAPLHGQLSVSVPALLVENVSVSDTLEKEKRTPKANQYYRNPDFITGKEKFPPVDSHKKSKSNGSKKGADSVSTGIDKFYAQAFKSCSSLLMRLMKHKHGWVFNNPVDAKGLGLYDYHIIIKHPMDLGTVKSRLNTNWYKSPREFAEDVRLTFRNAMTYNPKGQDVHTMAEQLLKIFEEKWPSIEAEFTMSPFLMVPKKLPPPPLDMRRVLERSDSTTHQVLPDSTPKAVSYTPHSSRPPALKKPKAKDLNKRDMTFDEKQKLSNNLQNLPSEKLDIVVQIIKKRNSSLSQHDDEIEVDIDSVDIETLWELDRFVTNYKKSLSKHKRKAELAIQAKQEAEKNAQKLLNHQAEVVGEVPVERKTDEKNVGHSSPVADKAKGDNESLSSSSCSSSSDAGSSSSDSDSESSSS